jgi:hypothetical protein
MRNRPLRQPVRRTVRAIFVALAVLAYFGSAIGFPVAVRPIKVSGQPFPCQHRACGCLTAQHCQHACCCFSPAEKLAWAQAHEVEWEQPTTETEPTCCQQHAPAPRPVPRKTAEALGTNWVIGSAHHECRGLSTVWVGTVTTLPTAPVAPLTLDGPAVGWVRPVAVVAFASPTMPLVPPPRPA